MDFSADQAQKNADADDFYLDFDKIMAEIKTETLMDAPAEDYQIDPDILPVFDKTPNPSESGPLSFDTACEEAGADVRSEANHLKEAEEKTEAKAAGCSSAPIAEAPKPDLAERKHRRQEEKQKPVKKTRKEKKAEKKKKRTKLGVLSRVLIVLWVLLLLYYVVAFSNIPFIKDLRTSYIQTALETMSHEWLARMFFPPSVVDPIAEKKNALQDTGLQSKGDWGKDPDKVEPVGTEEPTSPTEQIEKTPEEEFYDLFWEIDRPTMEIYLSSHPEALNNGWENLKINEAGLYDDGTVIYTTMGEQVLAINVPDQILIVRVEGFGYRGALAIAKDPSMLHNYVSTSLGVSGQCAGTIASSYNGVLAVNGSGFMDDGGTGNGGKIAGYTMADGVSYGTHAKSGYKRIELHDNDRMYIKDAGSAVGEGTTDATEFTPALIIDGVTVVDENDFWNGVNPRACLGQSDRFEILMLVIEGRNILDGVAGTGVVECAKILARHNCMQAMNLDGGATAIMWYDGEYITRCSNGSLEGRALPTAWVYTHRDN